MRKMFLSMICIEMTQEEKTNSPVDINLLMPDTMGYDTGTSYYSNGSFPAFDVRTKFFQL